MGEQNYNLNHPELRKGEVFYMNLGLFEFRDLEIESKRYGSISYNIYGQRSNGRLQVRPVFVDKEELKKFNERAREKARSDDKKRSKEIGSKIKKMTKKREVKTVKSTVMTRKDKRIFMTVTQPFTLCVIPELPIKGYISIKTVIRPGRYEIERIESPLALTDTRQIGFYWLVLKGTNIGATEGYIRDMTNFDPPTGIVIEE